MTAEGWGRMSQHSAAIPLLSNAQLTRRPRFSLMLGLNGFVVIQVLEWWDRANRQGFVEAFKKQNNRFHAAWGLISSKGEANLQISGGMQCRGWGGVKSLHIHKSSTALITQWLSGVHGRRSWRELKTDAEMTERAVLSYKRRGLVGRPYECESLRWLSLMCRYDYDSWRYERLSWLSSEHN